MNHNLFAGVLVTAVAAFGQANSGEPIKATVCEVVTQPRQFNGNIITLRVPIRIAFENSSLPAFECADRKLDGVWLEYGRGPKRQPTIWCCGDMVPRDNLVLVQNKEFRRFHHLMTAEKRSKGCYNCYLYQVTATLTGRFDAVETEPCPGDAAARCCGLGNFGHFGTACGRLVIQAVSNVAAKPAAADDNGSGRQR